MKLTTQVNTVVPYNFKFINTIALLALASLSVGCSDDWQSIKSSIQFKPAEFIEDKHTHRVRSFHAILIVKDCFSKVIH